MADTCDEVVGDLVHMLGVCPALHEARKRLIKFWVDKSESTPALLSFISDIVCSPPHELTQFVLDPSQFPAIMAMLSGLVAIFYSPSRIGKTKFPRTRNLLVSSLGINKFSHAEGWVNVITVISQEGSFHFFSLKLSWSVIFLN